MNSAESRRKALLIAAGVFYVLMIGIGSIPGEANDLGALLPDYVSHFLAYGFMSLLIAMGQGPASVRRSAIVLVAIALMGAVDEAIQSQLSYRTSDIHDWMVDMLAACVVTIGYALAHMGLAHRGPLARPDRQG